MRQEKKLKEKYGTKLPYAVPDGYFESLKSKVMTALPDYPEKPAEKNLTVWQRIKPYVYLAAMFAGIWCMMQIFHRVSTETPAPDTAYYASLEQESYDYFVNSYDGNDIELEEEITEIYPSMDEFKRDFYAQL